MLSKSTKIFFNYAIGLGLFIWLSFSLYHEVRDQKNLRVALLHLREIWDGPALWVLLLVLLMMVVNWGIEARKWQLLVQPLEDIPFLRSFYAILSGVSFSVNTPNRIGEYGGRVLYLKNTNKLRAISVTLVGSFSQLIVTIFIGLIGLVYYINNFNIIKSNSYFAPNFWEKIVLFILIAVAAATLFFYFRLQVIVSIFNRIRILHRFRRYVVVINRFSTATLARLLLLSACRYVVFSAQYLILLRLMGVEILWWQGFLMVSTIYLVMSLLPTIAIAEIGIRGQVGLYFLGLLSNNSVGIIAATFGIWFINLIIPAIAGSILMLGIRIFTDK